MAFPIRMACKGCRKLKVKCVGGLPCIKCQARGRKCIPHFQKGVKNAHVLILDEEEMVLYVARYWKSKIVNVVFMNEK